MVEFRKPVCKLVGTDGNVFRIIGQVTRTLEQDSQSDRAKEWAKRAFACKSYDEVLKLVFEYVDPE